MLDMNTLFSPAQQQNIQRGHFSSRPNVWTAEDRVKAGFDAIAVDISKATTAEEVLRLAGADFKVGHTHLFSFTGNLGENMSKQIPGTEAFVTKVDTHKMMWRLKDGKPSIPLGVVGIGWTPRQPEDSLGDLLEWIQEGTPDKAYLYTDSTRLHIRYRMADTRILGDEVIAYSNVTDSYDGSTAYCLTDEIVRGVCRNGLVKLVEGSRNFRRKHTKSINSSRQMIQAIMGSLRAKLQDLNTLAEETVRIAISEPRWQGIVEELLPIPEDVKDEQLRVIEEKRSLLYTAIDLPDLANFKNSGWGVLNAIADFTTHLGQCTRLGNMDTQVRKSRELNESNPMLEQGLVLVRALAN